MPRECYEPRDFQEHTLAVVAQAHQLVEQYMEQGLTLTLRQLYYRFVAQGWLPNTERDYKRLGRIVSHARLAGYLDWEAIEDRGRSLRGVAHWQGPEEAVEQAASRYRLDRWEGQPHRVEVWVEKQALESVVGQAAVELDVDYYACKGYTSQSEMWRAAKRLRQYFNEGCHPVIVHLGDHDPSGIDMTRDIQERLRDLFLAPVQVDRIALTMEQVREHDPPPNPAKVSDSRYEQYVLEYGPHSWELDALPPEVLRELIDEAVRGYMDEELWEERRRLEKEQRRRMRNVAARWGELADMLDDGEEGV